MDVASGLAAIQGAMTCLKAISSGLKTVKEIDQKLALLSVREQLVELQERLLDARDQTSELIGQNQELRQQLTIKEEIQHQEDGNILWRVVNGQNKGPYCSTCYGAESKLISFDSGVKNKRASMSNSIDNIIASQKNIELKTLLLQIRILH